MYTEVKNWMYRNARHLELCLWQYFFENGTKEAVVEALMVYQNEDGGFGHALEADNWNPGSTPITTNYALQILREIAFADREHPIYRGIWKYLESEKDLQEYGWRFTVPENDGHPHAPWWNYNEEENKKEYFGVTAELSAFILEYGGKDSSLWKKAEHFAHKLLSMLVADTALGDMGLTAFITLADTVRRLDLAGFAHDRIADRLAEKVSRAIEYDTEKWAYYTVRPSAFIRSPQSPFYKANEEILKKELTYLAETRPPEGVWPITWTWFGNMEQYGAFFSVSENWWKGVRAVENMRLLREFGMA